MSKEKIGEVNTPSGYTCYVFWDDQSGDVYVAAEYAGNASTKDGAMTKAQKYAYENGYSGPSRS